MRARTKGRPAPMAELWSNYGLPFALIVAQSLALLVTLLIIVAFLLYADRKIWAAVQMRRGPNVVGPWGLLQSFADLLKFVFKEPVIPAGSNKGVFLLAPLVTCTLALAAWAVIPVNAGWLIANINVGVLYIFAISSLMVYGIIMAVLLCAGSLNLSAIVAAQERGLFGMPWLGFLNWYWLPLLPMFVVFFV